MPNFNSVVPIDMNEHDFFHLLFLNFKSVSSNSRFGSSHKNVIKHETMDANLTPNVSRNVHQMFQAVPSFLSSYHQEFSLNLHKLG